ncbi:hypothetical protein Tco_0078321 [Tanacetum coccineum]
MFTNHPSWRAMRDHDFKNFFIASGQSQVLNSLAIFGLEKLHFLALLLMTKFSRICFSFVILEVLLSEYFGLDMNYVLNFFCSLPNRHP